MKPRNVIIEITYDDGTVVQYNRNYLVSFQINIEGSSDNTLPSYGINANSGTLVLKDKDDEILTRLKAQTTPVVNVVIYLNGTKMFNFKTSAEVDHDVENKQLTFTLVSRLIDMQNMEFSYPIQKALYIAGTTPFTAFLALKESSLGFDFIIDPSVTSQVYNQASGIIFYPNQTLWDAWDAFCQALQLRMYLDKDGYVKLMKPN